MLYSDYEEDMEDGNVRIFVRNGIFQVRIYKGDRSYIYRSLKTQKIGEARKEALRLFHVIQFKQQEGLPLTQIPMRAGPVCLDRFSTAISGALRGKCYPR